MKRAIFLPPLIAALLFTGPQAWDMLQNPSPTYVPVVYELLMLVFSYATALAVNVVLIVPLAWLLIRFASASVITGLVFGLLLAFVADVVAYAFEIFEYRPSIFHPAYLYTVFVPLLCLAWLGFLFVAWRPPGAVEPEQGSGEDVSEPGGE